jgi:superfamily I DNA/RNA helicase
MAIDHKTERSRDVANIKNSKHPRKIIVAGPGTGKSFLFGEIIKQKQAEGKTKFLAITFIGKLGDALADDLCGLAKTTTMHSFARAFVFEKKKWVYYPRMHDLTSADLQAEGIAKFTIGDKNYLTKTEYYGAVGDGDVIHYAVQICKQDSTKIPIHDLILIDEYQDFNEIESEFVDVLAQKNDMVVVGDDDQALYAFKGSSPSFIRLKYDPQNTDWESFTLRFCSRCTEVIIRYFHALIKRFDLNNPGERDPAKKRVGKDYICYVPEGEPDSKIKDSRLNSQIHLIANCPVGMIAYKIRRQLETITEGQKVKDVLVIGEGQICAAILGMIAWQLSNYGFRNVDSKGRTGILPVKQEIVDAYKLLAREESSVLGWRILGNPSGVAKERHLKNAATLDGIIGGTPSKLDRIKFDDVADLERALESWTTAKGEMSEEDQKKEIRKRLLIKELKNSNLYLTRPLRNLDITVCNILNSKGLGADVVFLVGFDQGKFPSKKDPTPSEVYQMLVAITRAKKRLILINTIGKKISTFGDSVDNKDLDVEKVEVRS